MCIRDSGETIDLAELTPAPDFEAGDLADLADVDDLDDVHDLDDAEDETV